MALFELIILLLLGGALLVAWARRIGAPYPALLSLAGAAAALLPGAPALNLDPQLTLTLFVAPTLLDAAFDASPRDMRENWLPIGALAVIVVGLTVAAVATLAHAVVPGMSWAAAIALGAIVAPPDASAATAVLRQLDPPHRLMVILEGESLVNDAAALLIYRIAVGAALGDAVMGWTLAPVIAGTVIGGGVLGWAAARLWLLIPVQRAELALSVLLQFLGTFAVWILAERIGVSAIMTVVVYAMVLARRSPLRTPARNRLASYAVWDVVVFVLNVLAFVLIGLQLKPILLRLDGSWPDYLALAGAICALTVVVRAAWVFGYVTVRRLRRQPRDPGGKGAQRPTYAGATLVSWCGMRGIVTLASALALPDGFPARDLILFCAFAVVLVTLVVQGLTLRPLMRLLPIPVDGSVAAETRLARAATARAALALFEARAGGDGVTGLAHKYLARADADPAELRRQRALVALHAEAVAEQRRTLLELRQSGAIGDDAFHRIEEELDLIELTSDPRLYVPDPGS